MVPYISDKELDELALRIRPLVRFERVYDKLVPSEGDRGDLYLILPVASADLRARMFTANPEADGLAPKIMPVETIPTFHPVAGRVFKATIAEVLAHIAVRPMAKRVTHFHTVHDVRRQAVMDKGVHYHLARTYLYREVH